MTKKSNIQSFSDMYLEEMKKKGERSLYTHHPSVKDIKRRIEGEMKEIEKESRVNVDKNIRRNNNG